MARRNIEVTLLGELRGQVEKLADEHQVLPAGQVLVDRGVLPGQADPSAYPLGMSEYVDAGDLGRAGVRAQQRRQHAYGGRLARAVRAQYAEHGTPGHRQVHAVQRLGGTEPLGQPLGAYREIGHDDGLLPHSRRCRCATSVRGAAGAARTSRWYGAVVRDGGRSCGG
jgi:hypothetical protein